VTLLGCVPGQPNLKTWAAMLNTVKDKGIDIVDVSAGVVSPVKPDAYLGYQVKFAEIIKEDTGLPVMAGGLLILI